MKMKNILIGGAAVILLVIIGIALGNVFSKNIYGEQTYSTNTQSNNLETSGNNVETTANSATTTTGTIQSANLALVDFSYKLTPNKLIKGVPVRIIVDESTLSGCMKNVVIKDFGVSKTIKPGDNVIEFIPDKTGTFWITCSMGMGPGSFEVVNADGTVDANSQTAQGLYTATGSTCSMGGAGCGCGGR